jgi:hypothetical protein
MAAAALADEMAGSHEGCMRRVSNSVKVTITIAMLMLIGFPPAVNSILINRLNQGCRRDNSQLASGHGKLGWNEPDFREPGPRPGGDLCREH